MISQDGDDVKTRNGESPEEMGSLEDVIGGATNRAKGPGSGGVGKEEEK